MYDGAKAVANNAGAVVNWDMLLAEALILCLAIQGGVGICIRKVTKPSYTHAYALYLEFGKGSSFCRIAFPTLCL